MNNKTLPLQELSIEKLYNGDKATFEIPKYQRNYAWERDEIFALIQDVYDAYKSSEKSTYYIGTLVSFHKGDNVYEVIDGQQRLTTIYLILKAFKLEIKNRLTYRARKKSDKTIESIPKFDIDEKDNGIVKGYKFVEEAIEEIVTNDKKFQDYFQKNVHIIHYQVPKDVDLNHYFEIMNSRGEQLEKHEIVKARLIEKLNKDDKSKFNLIWENCSEMGVYIQKKYQDENIFGDNYDTFTLGSFCKLPALGRNKNTENGTVKADDNKLSIDKFVEKNISKPHEEKDRDDSFQPIIDFPNFLLIVLKLTLREKNKDITLDDKGLIKEFNKAEFDKDSVKDFGFKLLKAKFFLDNYIVHHSNETETLKSNPWKLQRWHKENKNEYLKNLSSDKNIQDKLVHLLSMFEVTYTARQRKNYLFYCLLYLFDNEKQADEKWNVGKYSDFVAKLAEKYFKEIYLSENTGNFDNVISQDFDKISEYSNDNETVKKFNDLYGNGENNEKPNDEIKFKRIPLFVFNYMDYKLWEKYADRIHVEASIPLDDFFDFLGCSKDIGLDVFNRFYFSGTRKSLEHYYPQAFATGENDKLNKEQINCFGNFAMIGSEANSSGSNWSPKTKLVHYLDTSKKIKPVSVASLKFRIMMQICKDNQDKQGECKDGEEWSFEDIEKHQKKMLEILGLK